MDVIQTLGKYEIRGTLGKGAMGTVYDGWDPAIARRVAIKTVMLPVDPDPDTAEEIARFRREAQAAGRLTHPNIVAVYDYGETADMAYIVMEFVDGPSLKAPLDNHERFALGDIQRVMGDLLAGLQFSHERGVVHRDIKPANIMTTLAGQAKIADFGIARIEMSSMTQAGTMLGTPSYMSPEQFRGEVVDARTDVYSSGVVLYQLLTGERPFEGGLTAIMHKVLTTEPPVPSALSGTCPASLDAVVKRAMAKRPDDRYPSAAAFSEAIKAALAAPVPRAVDPLADILGDDSEATMVGATLVRPVPAAGRTAVAGGEPVARVEPPVGRGAAPAVVAPRTAGGSRLPVFIGLGVVVVLALGIGGWFAFAPSPHAPVPEVAGQVSPGQPVVGQQAEGQQAPGQQVPGQQAEAQSPTGSTAGSPTTGQPTAGQPATAQPAPAQPASGQPAMAQQTTGLKVGQSSVPGTGSAPVTPAPSQSTAQLGPASPGTTAPAATPAAPTPVPGPAAGPTPVVAPVGPAPVQVAATDLRGVREQIAQALAQSQCALAKGLVQDSGALSVTGYAGSGMVDALHRQLAGVAGAAPLDWNVQPVDPVFCGALGVLRPIAAQGGAPVSGLSLTLAGGETTLRDGQRIMPRVTMAGFSGVLRVDYLGHDGSVVHLYPTAADPAQHVEAVPSVRLAPGAPLAVGEGGPGRPVWEVGPPYGTDMIIAIASSAPLLARPPAQNAADNAVGYLSDLAAGIARVRQAGGQVSGTLLLVDTLAK